MEGYKVEHKMQIKLIHKLYEAWRNNPTLRFGQLISCVVKDKDLFAVYNEQFLSMLEAFGNEHSTTTR